jgi:hypothetical protein
MGHQKPLRNNTSEMPFKRAITSKTDRKQGKTTAYVRFLQGVQLASEYLAIIQGKV